MDRPSVIAIDPGVTTGWAVLDPDGSFRSGEVRGPYDFLRRVYEMVQSRVFDYELVVERYTITPETIKKSRQTDPLEIIGALRFFAAHYKTGFTLQSPAEAKAFSTDAKLKRMRWFTPGQGHANDAARHLLCYSISKGYIPIEWITEGR